MDEFRIYTTKECNSYCSFCSYVFRTNKDYMNTDVVWSNPISLKNLERMREDFKVDAFMFSGIEPLLSAAWFDLSLFTNIQEVRLNTNGLVLERPRGLESFLDSITLLTSIDKKFWMYLSVHSMSKIDLFETLLSNHISVIPYIVVNNDNRDSVPVIMKALLDVGIRKFFIRFEYAVYRTSSERLDARIIPRHYHADIINTYLDVCIPYAPAVIDTPIDYASHLCSKDFPTGHSGIVVHKRFEHDNCESYERSLTINFNGDITGCAKHSYAYDPTPFIVGNIMTYDYDALMSSIAEKKHDRKFCLNCGK